MYTMDYNSAIGKNKTMSFAASWMDLEIIIVSKVSRLEKNKYHMILFICGFLKIMVHQCLFCCLVYRVIVTIFSF